MILYPIGSSMSGPNLEYFLSAADRAALAPRSFHRTDAAEPPAGRLRGFLQTSLEKVRLFVRHVHDARLEQTGARSNASESGLISTIRPAAITPARKSTERTAQRVATAPPVGADVSERRAEAMRRFYPKLSAWFAQAYIGEMEAAHRYLSESTDVFDLERRIGRIERERRSML